MAPPSLIALLYTVVVAVTLTAAAAEEARKSNDTVLILSACNHTLYYDVCVSSLGVRRGGASDLRGLAGISLAVGTAHARATISYARNLSRQQEGAGSGGYAAYVAGCLRDCLEEYGDAVASLRESAAALRRGSYERVKDLVSGAMTNSDTCEDAFTDKPGLQSPLTERNDYFFKLCSNSIAITSLLLA